MSVLVRELRERLDKYRLEFNGAKEQRHRAMLQAKMIEVQDLIACVLHTETHEVLASHEFWAALGFSRGNGVTIVPPTPKTTCAWSCVTIHVRTTYTMDDEVQTLVFDFEGLTRYVPVRIKRGPNY